MAKIDAAAGIDWTPTLSVAQIRRLIEFAHAQDGE